MNGIDDLMKWNCSTIFLLNPLGLDKKRLDKIGFVETYLGDEFCQIEYKNPVFLLFKPENIGNFQVFVENEYDRINRFTGTKDLKADYDRKEGEVMLVYEFPFDKDYEKFKAGKYSEFSAEVLRTYPRTLKSSTGAEILGLPYRIITKDKESESILNSIYGENFLVQQPIIALKDLLEERYDVEFTADMELWTLPNLEKETLKI